MFWYGVGGQLPPTKSPIFSTKSRDRLTFTNQLSSLPGLRQGHAITLFRQVGNKKARQIKGQACPAERRAFLILSNYRMIIYTSGLLCSWIRFCTIVLRFYI